MAQLRDTLTSELIAEGPPEDLVLIVDELGPDGVLWDDAPSSASLASLRESNAETLSLLPEAEAGSELARRAAIVEVEAPIALERREAARARADV